MSFLNNFFKKTKEKSSSEIANERLQLILARNKKGNHSFDIEAMEKELIEVVKKYVHNGNIEITSEENDGMEALAIEVKF